MQPVTTKKVPPSRSRAWIPISLVAVAVALAGLLLWLLRAPAPAASAPRAANAGTGSYRNRAVFRRASAPAEHGRRLVIQGSVYGATGETIAGANVVATTFDRAGNIPSPVGDVKSDPSGHFEIPLPEGTYQLNASMSGYGPSAITAESGDTVSIVLPKSGVLQGHVRDERGRPVQRFTIDLVSVVPGDAPAPPPIWSKAFESRDGTWRADQLPPWPVIVRASAEDHAPAFSLPIGAHAGETRDVDLTMTDGCTLTGTVVDKKGNPVSGVLVNAEERVSAGSAADPTLQTSTQAQSQDDGTFSLDHVPVGTVLVRGYDGDYAVSTTTVKISDCSKLAPVKLTMTTGGTVTGVARKADGTPIAGARLSVADRSIGYVNVVSGADGRFRFEAIPAGPVRLELEHEGQRAMRYLGLKDGETVTQDIMLLAGGNGELRGTVTAGKKPISGARLLVAANHGDQGIAMYFPVTGPDGTFRVPSIPEGNYLVSVMSTTAAQGVVVHAGEVATADLDAGFVMPSSDATPKPPTRKMAPVTPQPSP
jgi:protocatechuate 3,4-dioxygenase beta subunit